MPIEIKEISIKANIYPDRKQADNSSQLSVQDLEELKIALKKELLGELKQQLKQQLHQQKFER